MEKKKFIIFFGLAFLANLIITPIFLLVNNMMICHWNEILPGEPLPSLTNFALFFGYIWPCVFLLLHLASFILSFKVPKQRLMNYTLATYLLEIIIIAITLYGYIFPMFNIMYRLG